MEFNAWMLASFIAGIMVSSLFWSLILSISNKTTQKTFDDLRNKSKQYKDHLENDHTRADWWQKGDKPLGDAW